MRLVVDTNILFTYFWRNSVFNKLLKEELELFSPKLALKEIHKYSSEIIRKTKLTKKEFEDLIKDLALEVEFIPIKEYSSLLKKATQNLEDKKDADLLALALRLHCPIWSNDKHLKQQKLIITLTTKEIVDLLAEDIPEELL